MNKPKHTPGPWNVEQDIYGRYQVQHATGDTELLGGIELKHSIANVHAPFNAPEGTAKANARLIAAAPELLDALKACADKLGDYEAENDEPVSPARRNALSLINQLEQNT